VRAFRVLLLVCAAAAAQASQPAPERVDTAAVARIKEQGYLHSRVMETASRLTNVIGPRLTGSREYRRAAEWAKDALAKQGLEDAHLESGGFFGRGWTLQRHSLNVVQPVPFPVVSCPRAWSPGTNGKKRAEVVLFDAASDSALPFFKGKLKGKVVIMEDPVPVEPQFTAPAQRETEKSLLELSNASAEPRSIRRVSGAPASRAGRRMVFATKKARMATEEGAMAFLSASRLEAGNVGVQGAFVPVLPDEKRVSVYDPAAPAVLPQVVLTPEHYNRIHRMLTAGEKVVVELDLAVQFTPPDSVWNVIAELPGTDLKDEVVMIGAHLDSWHGGTGATDNAAGVAVCMEAMRILTAAGLSPRRTIRIALWGGEEQGLLGSEGYVERHFGTRTGDAADSTLTVTLLPAAEKFSAYFNMDNGTGRFRGVYMQRNEALRPIFRTWLDALEDTAAVTLSARTTGSTDHVSFNALGLPGFQFIQDDVEYFSRSWHSTMDTYERLVEEDLKQASVVMAAFAYNAATRDERLPRLPLRGVKSVTAAP
jgi:hypothetical protein